MYYLSTDAIIWDYSGGDTFCQRCGGYGVDSGDKRKANTGLNDLQIKQIHIQYIIDYIDAAVLSGAHSLSILRTYSPTRLSAPAFASSNLLSNNGPAVPTVSVHIFTDSLKTRCRHAGHDNNIIGEWQVSGLNQRT